MPKALVLIIVDPKIEQKVIDEIRGYPGVRDAHYIYGPFDMYVKLEAGTEEEINNLVLNKIRRLYGIVSTTTCLIIE